jgi:hypothetical protein
LSPSVFSFTEGHEGIPDLVVKGGDEMPDVLIVAENFLSMLQQV